MLRRRLLRALVAACAVLAAWLLWWQREGTARRDMHARPAAHALRQSSIGSQPGSRLRVALQGASVSGHVMQPNGRPAPGAAVCALPRPLTAVGLGEALCTETDADGGYRLALAWPNTYYVYAIHSAFAPGFAREGEGLELIAAGETAGVDMVLQDASGKLSGVVLDQLGGVVVGARVAVFHPLQQRNDFRVPITTLTNEAGEFMLGATAGNLKLVATADGYAQTSLSRIAPATGLRVIMKEESRLGGRVLCALDRRPLPGITVRAKPHGALPAERTATSDDAGRFSIDGLAGGVYELHADGAGWRDVEAESVLVEHGATRDGLTVMVHPGVTVEGHIQFDDATPCAEGRVTLKSRDARGAIMLHGLTGLTQHAGRVEIADVIPGDYDVLVVCTGSSLVPESALHVAAEPVRDLLWKVERGLTLTVETVDRQGRPVAHVPLTLAAGSDTEGTHYNYALSQESDARGRAKLTALRPGAYAISSPLARARLEVELRAQDAGHTLRLEVDDAGTIEVVARRAGAPVSALLVYATDSHDSNAGVATELGGGRYRVGPLAAGAYHVYAHDGVNPPVQASAAGSADIAIRAGVTTPAELLLDDDTASISGRVVDPEGLPVESMAVFAISDATAADSLGRFKSDASRRDGAGSYTRADGSFTIEGLTRGAHFEVQARRPLLGCVARAAARAGGFGSVELRVAQPGVLAGRVVDPQGEPVQDFEIALWNAGAELRRQQTFLRPDGRWSLEDVSPGTVDLAARDRAGRTANLALEVSAGARRDGIELVLVEPTPLTAAEAISGP